MTKEISLVKVCKIKILLKKLATNDDTISSNRSSIAQNKNQLNVAKEKLKAAPSDTSAKQNIENFQNCDTVSDDVNNQCNKSQFIS